MEERSPERVLSGDPQVLALLHMAVSLLTPQPRGDGTKGPSPETEKMVLPCPGLSASKTISEIDLFSL